MTPAPDGDDDPRRDIRARAGRATWGSRAVAALRRNDGPPGRTSLLSVHSRLIAARLPCFLAQSVYGAARSVAAGYRLLQAIFRTFSGCYLAVPAIYQVSTGQAAWGR